jgi:hypothetical protein
VTSSAVSVRGVLPGDIAQAVDLLKDQEFTQGNPPDLLRRVFDYPWTPDRPFSGFVLTDGDRIVGCAGLIFSTRTIDGRAVRFANATTWYVELGYRRHSLLMMRAALAIPDVTQIVLSASPHTAPILEKLGFEVISRRRLFFGPVAQPGTALARGAEIRDGATRVAEVLGEEHLRILRDHQPFDCHHYAVTEGGRTCYLVTKRRWERGWFLPRIVPRGLRRRRYPVSDVLYVSEPEMALRHWLPLRWRMARRERTVGVTVEESFLGGLAPPAASTPHRIHVHGLRTDPRTIDGLYSELVLLPH